MRINSLQDRNSIDCSDPIKSVGRENSTKLFKNYSHRFQVNKSWTAIKSLEVIPGGADTQTSATPNGLSINTSTVYTIDSNDVHKPATIYSLLRAISLNLDNN